MNSMRKYDERVNVEEKSETIIMRLSNIYKRNLRQSLSIDYQIKDKSEKIII